MSLRWSWVERFLGINFSLYEPIRVGMWLGPSSCRRCFRSPILCIQSTRRVTSQSPHCMRHRSVESISERPPPHILHIFNSKCEQIYSSAGDLQGSFMSLSSSATASSPPLTMMILNDIYLPLPAWPSGATHHHHPHRPYFIACTLSSSSVSLPYK